MGACEIFVFINISFCKQKMSYNFLCDKALKYKNKGVVYDFGKQFILTRVKNKNTQKAQKLLFFVLFAC